MKVKTIPELKCILENYEEICDRAKGISLSLKAVNKFELDRDNLILWGTPCRGYGDKDSDSFPVEWLFKTNEEIVKIRDEKRREEELRNRKKMQGRKKQWRDSEYTQYLRLKEKFEPQE